MSRENVELLRANYAAFNRRDWDLALAAYAPDAEWHEPDLPEAAVYRGRAEIRAYWESLLAIIPDFRSDPQRFWEAGGTVVAATTVGGTGSSSDVAVAGEVGMVWTVRNGEITRCVVHRRLKEALEAVGLRE